MTAAPAERPAVLQLLAAAAPSDAVTDQALALRAELRAAGIPSAIAAQHVDDRLRGAVVQLDRAPAGVPILLRYSIWSDAAERALRGTERLAVVYHNITPPSLIGTGNPAVAALCERGRRELPRVAARAQVLIADSTYNADDLRAAGGTAVRVLPLLLDLPSPPAPSARGSNEVLYVGRLAPSKRVEDCIDALVLLRRRRPGAHLHLVGSGDAFPAYEAALRRHARQSGVPEAVTFHGRVDDATRDRLYEQAGAYLSLSEHEGFCVPVLEAMAHGLPVVARDAGAVRETAGGGALLLPGRNAALAAAALDTVLGDAAVRAGIAANSRARLSALDRSVVAPAFVSAVREILT